MLELLIFPQTVFLVYETDHLYIKQRDFCQNVTYFVIFYPCSGIKSCYAVKVT